VSVGGVGGPAGPLMIAVNVECLSPESKIYEDLLVFSGPRAIRSLTAS
jgi:hypothetical protein